MWPLSLTAAAGRDPRDFRGTSSSRVPQNVPCKQKCDSWGESQGSPKHSSLQGRGGGCRDGALGAEVKSWAGDQGQPGRGKWSCLPRRSLARSVGCEGTRACGKGGTINDNNNEHRTKKKEGGKSLQHPVFPGGLPSKY